MTWFRILLISLLLILPLGRSSVEAAVVSRTDLYFLSAMVSMASYSDELNMVTRDWLQGAGWKFESHETVTAAAEGRFHLVCRTMPSGNRMYILAFPGTERLKDAEVDLRLSRVPFGGSNPVEFQQFADGNAAPAGTPLVHRGFNDYTRVALFQTPLKEFQGRTAGEVIAQELKQHPAAMLYLTGHSLGGATATLAAARFSDMGVLPQQLQVITFGAPAVGDEAFANHYRNRMNLSRIVISGDPVKSVLQSLSGRFAQFGIKIEWSKNRNSERFAHDMVVYLDQALRNRYDHKHNDAVEDTDLLAGNAQAISGGIYVAPVQIKLDDHIQSDQPYMKASLKDALSANYSTIEFAPVNATTDIFTLCRQAAAKNMKYVLVERFQGTRIKNEPYNFRLRMDEELYDVKGNLLTMQSNSTTARNLTPIEGMLYLQHEGRDQREKFIH